MKKVATILLILGLSVTPGFLPGQTIPAALQTEMEKNIELARSYETAGDINSALPLYTKTATTYWVNGNSEEARKLFIKAIALSERIGNTNALKMLLTNLGMLYVDEENYPEAIVNFEKCLSLNRKQNNKTEIASTLLNIANAQKELGQLQKSLNAAEEASKIAAELNDPKLMRNSYSLLSELYKEAGNDEKSAEYFTLYSAFSKKIQREEQLKKENEAKKIVSEAQSQLHEIKTEKELTEQELMAKQHALTTVKDSLQKVEQLTREQRMEIDLLAKENALRDARIKNQILIRNIFIIAIILTLGIAGLITYYYLQKKRSNELLAHQKNMLEVKSNELMEAIKQVEKQNRDITSSINYAQRIQQALLPTYNTLVTVINDSFIMLRPREIVSGDFYWFAGYTGADSSTSTSNRHFIHVPSLKEGEGGFLIAAVDCTGHGVPGAFMSMIGLNLIDNLVRTGRVRPDLLLGDLHKLIRYLLKQEESDNRDGMDIAICNIKNDGQTVEFAGAKNPLFYVTNGQVNQVRGDPVPVGGLQKEKERQYTLHTIHIDTPTCFYIFSDGYIDQFGGPYNQKFSSQQFKELLLKVHQLPMIQQQEILETTMDEWQGSENKQIDDIMVIGFRLNAKPLGI